MNFTPPPNAPEESVAIPNRRTDAQDAFDIKTDVYLNWLTGFRNWTAGLVTWMGTFLSEMTQAMLTVESNKNAAQTAASAAESSAQNAAIIAGAPRWAPGNYAQGDAVWSPLSMLTYRRVLAGITPSAVDPAQDPAGWRLSGSPFSLPQQELVTAGPHQLLVGMHYLIRHPQCVCLMPAAATVQEQVRITNRSNSLTPVLKPNGGMFSGVQDDMTLDSRFADRTFTQTATLGWI